MIRALLVAIVLAGCGGTSPAPVCRTEEEMAVRYQDRVNRIAMALGACAVTVALEAGTTEGDTGSTSERTTGVASFMVCIGAGAASFVQGWADDPPPCPRRGDRAPPDDAGVP